LHKLKSLDTSSARKKRTTPIHSYPPYLNMFRGKPAITKFDWLITPNHKSS